MKPSRKDVAEAIASAIMDAPAWSEVGSDAGLSERIVYYWATGERTPNILGAWALADYLGITLDALVGRTPPEVSRIPTQEGDQDAT